jgi:hypothetical protein
MTQEIPIYDEARVPVNARAPYIVTYWENEIDPDIWIFEYAELVVDANVRHHLDPYSSSEEDIRQAAAPHIP